jgi:hypothetical protein
MIEIRRLSSAIQKLYISAYVETSGHTIASPLFEQGAGAFQMMKAFERSEGAKLV